MRRRLLVIGCARSGTRFTSRALCHAGVDVLHEATGADGTVSWYFAAPTSDGMPPPHPVYENGKHHHYDGIRREDVFYDHVVHQIRHPLKVMGSCIPLLNSLDWQFAARHLGMSLPKSRLGRAAIYWLHWNAICESQAERSYRIEDIDQEWPRLLALVGAKPCPVPPISRTIHRQGGFKKPHIIGWNDVIKFSPVIAASCQKQAARYGYEV